MPERVRTCAEAQESDGRPRCLSLAMAHEKVAVPAVEFAMGALLTRALLPRAYRRDISHGEIAWHTRVLRSAGISNPCDAIREERRTIPKGGPGDHTFFKVKAEKSFVLQDLRLAAHRQKELGEVTWPTPRDADPASWGPTWQHKEDKEDKDARSELKRESADQSADQSAERALTLKMLNGLPPWSVDHPRPIADDPPPRTYEARHPDQEGAGYPGELHLGNR